MTTRRKRNAILTGALLGLALIQSTEGGPARLFDAPSRVFDTGRFEEGASPVEMATGDLDGDGDADVVMGATWADPGLTVMRNNGDRTFERAAHSPIGTPEVTISPRDIKLTDFDGDGDLDALATVSSFSGSELYVWRNRGDATFEAPSVFPTAAGAEKMIVADLTGDGFPDVAIGNWRSSGNLTRLIHNGQAGAAAAYGDPLSLTVGSANIFDLAAADLNGDGRVDLIAGSSDGSVTGASLYVVMNQGNNAFASPVAYNPAPNATGRGYSVAAADMDNDGDVDLIGEGFFEPPNTGETYAAFTILRNNGSGTFADAEAFRHADLFTAIDSIKTADLNGDGFADVLAATPTGRTPEGWNVMLSDGSGGYQPTKLYPSGQWTYDLESVDVDSDGDLDVLTVSRDSNALTFYQNPGSGVFPALPHYELASGNDATESADIDHDGDIDVVTNNEVDLVFNEGLVLVLKNNGNGTFATPVRYAQPRDFADMKLRDLNGDGFVDLVFAPDGDAPPFHLGFAMNRGDGTFESTVVLYMNACGEGTVDAFDLDNDGDPDIVFTEEQACPGSAQPLRIFIYRNDGNGTFVNVRQIPFFGGPRDLGGADLDHDGRIDLLTIHSYGMAYLRNLGGFQFAEPVISEIPTGTRLHLFELTDLDRDGELDVGVIVNQEYYSDRAGTMLGNGDGTFGGVRMQYGATALEPLRIASDIDVADVNGDGIPDLNITNYASNDLSLFLTNADGSLRPQQRYSIGNTPHRSAVADFDGDGRTDFAGVVRTNLIYKDYLVLLRNIAPPDLSGGVRLKTFALNDRTPTLTIDSYDGYIFTLQVAAAPGAEFTSFGQAQRGTTGSVLTFTGPEASAPSGFYRILVEPSGW